MNILFVCTANICRSVMAEAILNHLTSAVTSHRRVFAASAGIDAMEGRVADRYTVQVCGDQGIDVRFHKSRQLTKEMLGVADLVLCMEKTHVQRILAAFPEFTKKVFLLREYLHSDTPKESDIEDPVGSPLKRYEVCFNEIKGELERIGKVSDWLVPP